MKIVEGDLESKINHVPDIPGMQKWMVHNMQLGIIVIHGQRMYALMEKIHHHLLLRTSIMLILEIIAIIHNYGAKMEKESFFKQRKKMQFLLSQ